MKKFTQFLVISILMMGQAEAQSNALHFNGTDNIIINHGSNSLSGTFTIEFWANPSTLSMQGFLGSRGPSDASLDIQLTGSGGLHGDIGTGAGWLTTSADAPGAGLVAGQWSHIAYVITPTGYTIYVNAVQKASGSYSGTPLAFNPSHTLVLGNYGTNYGNGTYNGVLDEVRIWSVARTQTQLQDNMNAELSSGTGLVAAYHFNQGTAGGNNAGITTLIDATGPYNGTLNTFALTGATSNWVSGATALPVEMTTFTASPQEKSVMLHWQTTSETNNQGFEVQHSTDGRNWKALGFVAGNGTSIDAHDYSFLDVAPLPSPLEGGRGVIYYRLRQMDFDGKEEFSKVVSVEMTFLEEMSFLRVFPNPVSGGELTMVLPDAYSMTNEEEMTVQLFDQTGRPVRSTRLKAGTNRLDVSDLPTGIYMLEWSQGGARRMEKIKLVR